METLTNTQNNLLYVSAELGDVINWSMDGFANLAADIDAAGKSLDSMTVGELRELVNRNIESMAVGEIDAMLMMEDDHDR